MGSLEIVRAESTDLPAVMGLVRACVENMRRRGIDQWDDIYPAEPRFAADVEAGTLFIAVVDGARAMATFVLDEWQDPEYADVPWTVTAVRTGVVHRLMVHPYCQRRGIARELMRCAERLAVDRGLQAIRLDAFSLNSAALRLYSSLGYREAGSIVLRKGVFRCFEKLLGGAPGEAAVRDERPGDIPAIREVTRRAFASVPYGGGNEQDIIDALRAARALTVSLVSDLNGRVVGHVAFSPVYPADASTGWFALGPVSVEPELHRRGMGRSLIQEGLERLRALGAAGCVVVGDVRYYSQFGFAPAPAFAAPGIPADHFMMLCFRHAVPRGIVEFHPAFFT